MLRSKSLPEDRQPCGVSVARRSHRYSEPELTEPESPEGCTGGRSQAVLGNRTNPRRRGLAPVGELFSPARVLLGSWAPGLPFAMIALGLDWIGEMAFRAAEGSPAIELHSSTKGLPSPPEALAYAVMGCMAMDVVYVLRKGRHRLDALTVRFEGERAGETPKRFVSMALEFDVTTSAESRVVDRAIALSREKYCSVWHTIRPDVELTTRSVVRSIEPGPAPAKDV